MGAAPLHRRLQPAPRFWRRLLPSEWPLAPSPDESRQLIYNLPEQRFADAGVMSIEHSDFDGTERLALVLDGDIVSTFDTPERVKLGSCA